MKVASKLIRGREAPEELESKFLEQKDLFKIVYEIAQTKIDEEYKSSIKKSNYETPCWAERQADSIGYARALEEIKSLLQYTQE